MHIRTATPDDAEEVVGLVDQLLVELGGEPLASDAALAAFQVLVADPTGGLVIIVEDGDRMVGVCTLSYQDAIRRMGRYGTVQEMFVVPEYRSRGLGARVTERAIAEAQAHGCRVLELGTPPDGQRQEAFYERLGFSPVGLRFRRVIGARG